MYVLGTKSQKFLNWYANQGVKRNNGSYFYSKEIEDIILPKLKDLNVFVVTAGAILYRKYEIPDGSVIVCHDNRETKKSYGKFFGKNCLWICSKHSTVDTLESYGEKALYVPLSIDTHYVAKYKRKRRPGNTAFVGNAWGFKKEYLENLPKDIVQLSDMERLPLIKEMAKYKRVIAEGRVYLEAMILGCKVELPKYENITAEAPELFDSTDK